MLKTVDGYTLVIPRSNILPLKSWIPIQAKTAQLLGLLRPRPPFSRTLPPNPQQRLCPWTPLRSSVRQVPRWTLAPKVQFLAPPLARCVISRRTRHHESDVLAIHYATTRRAPFTQRNLLTIYSASSLLFHDLRRSAASTTWPFRVLSSLEHSLCWMIIVYCLS